MLEKFGHLDKGDAKALNDIDKYGCHILHVLEEGEYPRFSYSVGIEKCTGQPEIIVTGLKMELAQWMINEYNQRIKSGEVFEPNKLYDGFLDDFQIMFKEVQKFHFPEDFGWCKWPYGDDSFRVFQLIYPGTSGMWPWDENAPEDLAWFIPQLYAD